MGRIHTHNVTKGKGARYDQVGFFGCSDRLVRVGRKADGSPAPKRRVIDCPACSKEHAVNFAWRRARGDDLASVELWVTS